VEAYRNLRSSLLYIEGNHRPKTLLLTSSVPNEGKSITSGNLAITLARAGSKVLLVDADLRKGVLHNLFGLDSGTGLSDVLANGNNWQKVVRPTGIPNLSLVPCGTVAHNSSELFLGPATEQLLKTAVLQYDFVLLDTPPVMAADDVTSLAPHADSVLFVLRSEHTSARVARAALELLYQRQARILGIVFNAVRRGSADYHYYKYGDYYIKYPEVKTRA
jgi:capsular exopolysaccharide synthesis family protein